MSALPQTIGLGLAIDAKEARRRAQCALRGIDFGIDGKPGTFAYNMRQKLETGKEISPDQFRSLWRLILRWRAQVTDRLLLRYAEDHQ